MSAVARLTLACSNFVCICCSNIQCSADEYLADFTYYKPGRPDDSVFTFPELCAISPKPERHPFPTVAFQMSMLLPSIRHSKPYLFSLSLRQKPYHGRFPMPLHVFYTKQCSQSCPHTVSVSEYAAAKHCSKNGHALNVECSRGYGSKAPSC